LDDLFGSLTETDADRAFSDDEIIQFIGARVKRKDA
jgi:hypothetical protein